MLPAALTHAKAPTCHSGFALAKVEPGSVYEKLGLRSGDCLVTINDRKLVGIANAHKLVDDMLGQPGTVKVGVERGGKVEELTYTIK